MFVYAFHIGSTKRHLNHADNIFYPNFIITLKKRSLWCSLESIIYGKFCNIMCLAVQLVMSFEKKRCNYEKERFANRTDLILHCSIIHSTLRGWLNNTVN